MSKRDTNEEPSSGIIASIALLTTFVLGTTLIWALSEQGPKRVANTYEASKYHVSAQSRVEATCGGLEGIGFAECSIQIEQSERENHQTQKDIRAQRYMAIWAFLMAFGAIGTLGVTAVGLAWIKANLDETRKAVKSADDAVDVTRDIGQAQVRAYVGYKDTIPDTQIDLEKGVYLLKFNVVLTNYGQSPAKEITYRVSNFAMPEEWQGGEIQLPEYKIATTRGKTLGANQPVSLSVDEWLPAIVFDMWAAKKHRVFAYASCE